MQTVLYQIVVDMTKLLAPILAHTAEEVWSHIPHVEEESVHLTRMSERVEIDSAFVEKWNTFMKLRDDVNRALEVARNEKVIGKSLEAKVIISSNEHFDATSFLQQFTDLQQLFITSQVKLLIKLRTVRRIIMVTSKLNMHMEKNVNVAGIIVMNLDLLAS